MFADLIFEHRTAGLTLLGMGSLETMLVWGGVSSLDYYFVCKPGDEISHTVKKVCKTVVTYKTKLYHQNNLKIIGLIMIVLTAKIYNLNKTGRQS